MRSVVESYKKLATIDQWFITRRNNDVAIRQLTSVWNMEMHKKKSAVRGDVSIANVRNF